MFVEQGVVEAVRGRRAILRVQRSDSCARCSSRGACQTLADKEMRVELANRLNAKVGDVVEFSIPSGWLLKISALVYIIPIMALMAGAYAGSAWAQATGGDPTLPSVLGAGLGLGLSFGLIRYLGHVHRNDPKYEPVMTRVIPAAVDLLPCDSK